VQGIDTKIESYPGELFISSAFVVLNILKDRIHAVVIIIQSFSFIRSCSSPCTIQFFSFIRGVLDRVSIILLVHVSSISIHSGVIS
jgi:hypothetical protein